MSTEQLHRERETGLAHDVGEAPLRGQVDEDGQVTMAVVDDEATEEEA